ncbi:MAG: rRNA maturation RNase YbeY [Chloroflexi bacterium]|nr:rRNA maturation RNase YbeY [Chloroflexota bacterium]
MHRKISSRVDRARLKKIARKVLRAEKARGDVTIYVTDDAEMRALNRQFHATDATTDVLAFPARGNDVPAARRYIGDIIISYETARVHARDAGWRIADEIDLLAVHGILHLLGYDDRTPRARKKMWARQKEILGDIAGDE